MKARAPIRRIVWLLVALAAFAAPARALAAPTAQEMARAKDHFKRASQLQDAGRFDDAIAEYRAAYELSQLPEMLFNVGQAYRLKGDKRNAIAYYRKYLDAAPEGRGVGDAQSFIVALSRDVEVEDAAAARRAQDKVGDKTGEQATAQAAAQKKAAEDKAKVANSQKVGANTETTNSASASATTVAAAPAAVLAVPATPTLTPTPTPTPSPSPGSGLRSAGLVTMGAGVILAGIGAGFAVHAASLSSKQQCEGTACSTMQYDPGLISDGKAANRNAYIFAGAGAVALVGGGVLWYLGHRAANEPERAPRVAVIPSFGPTMAVLTLARRF